MGGTITVDSANYNSGAVEKYSPFLCRVSRIPGVNVDLAVEQMAGKHNIYEKALALFRDDLPGQIESIRKIMHDSDRKDLRIQMHGIKSVLASLGLMELRDRAQALETAAKEKNEAYLQANIDGFCEGLEAFASQLNDAINESVQE